MFGTAKTAYKAMLHSVLVTLIPSGLVAMNFLVILFELPGRDDPAPAIRFRNVAAKSGIGFVLENDPTPRKHLVETMAGGVAAFDYDGDGLTDIYFTNGASLPSLEKTSPRYWSRLYRNLGGFRFQDVTEKAGVAGAGYSMGAAAANYDNDGHVDLFVAGVGGNILYHNRGDGALEDVRSRSMWSQLTTPSSIVMPAQWAASAAAEHQRLGDEFLASRKFDQAIAEFKKALMI